MPAARYSEEFKEQVVREVVEKERTISSVASSYDLVPQTVGNWVARYKKAHATDQDRKKASESAEIAKLRAEVRELRQENEFLKKAAALTTVGGGAASAMGGQMARGAYAATREARYASWLWRTDRTAWRHYVRNARHRLIHDETGAASTSMWSPRNGLPAYWDDPRRVQQWFNNLPTRTNPPTTPAYQYQHRVLGTDVERHISSDAGDEIWADSVTIDRKSGITMAWDAKYTESGPKALYEGHAPKFIIKKFDAEIEKYREVINSPNNPVSQLNLVTNTPEAATYLRNRARKALGPNITLTVYVIP